MGAFLKAIYSPTKRSWYKNNLVFSKSPIFATRLNLYFSSMASSPIAATAAPVISSPLPTPELTKTQPTPEPSKPSESNKNTGLPSTDQLTQTVELAKQAQTLQAQILQGERQLSEVKAKADLEEFNMVLANLQKLVQEAQQIKKQLAVVTGDSSTPPAPEVKVEVVKPIKQKNTQMSLTSFPNIINGVITDSQGNYLDSVVVVIYNKDGLPVRALKTNKLGQFTGSTPLPNGTYRLELEKENLTFDVLQIELDGKVLPPLIIKAKKIIGQV